MDEMNFKIWIGYTVPKSEASKVNDLYLKFQQIAKETFSKTELLSVGVATEPKEQVSANKALTTD